MDWSGVVRLLPRAAGVMAEFAPVIGGAIVCASGWLYVKYLERHAHDAK